MAAIESDDISSRLGGLGPGEKFWKRIYPWLSEKGYQLRPRYSPDWTPSFLKYVRSNSTHKIREHADGISLLFQQVVDAVRLPDGLDVALKRIDKTRHPFEVDIMRYLSSEPLVSDPRNRCIPLLDILEPPDDPNMVILVMPLVREFTSPPFDTVGEVMECCRQLFEGLQFMHEHRVAHRDINLNNFMLQGKDMFPKKYHFQSDMQMPDLSGPAPYLTRTQCPPKYFIIDFGISSRYVPGNDAPLEPVIIGGDRYVPEFKDPGSSQNPFPTDVFCAGNMIRHQFIDGHPDLPKIRGCKGFEFLKPLISDMTQDDPMKRPTMDEVVRRFNDLVEGLTQWKLRSRVVPRRRNAFVDMSYVLPHWKRKAWFVITHISPLPRAK